MSKRNNLLILFVIIIIACLGQFGSDIYAPALPAIARDLVTSINLVQLSMAIYMAGAALSMLVYGPLSEGIGRKKPIVFGLLIFCVGSVLCWRATNIEFLIFGRLLQGAGVGAAMGLWRAIFRDLLSGNELAKYGSYFSILVTFIVPMAPMLGGFLQHYLGWQSIFIFLLIYASLALVLIFLIQETNQSYHRDKLRLTWIVRQYQSVFRHRDFIAAAFAVSVSYGAFFSWFVVSPVLLIQQLGLSSVNYGWINFIGGGFMYALSSWLNGRYVSRFGSDKMLRLGWSIMSCAGLLLLIGYWCWGSSLVGIVIPGLLFYFGTSFIWSNTFAKAMTPFGHIAGYAGSAYGFVQISGGAALGSLVAHLPSTNPLALGLIFLLVPMLAYSLYCLRS